jgi:hypothetical protein
MISNVSIALMITRGPRAKLYQHNMVIHGHYYHIDMTAVDHDAMLDDVMMNEVTLSMM